MSSVYSDNFNICNTQVASWRRPLPCAPRFWRPASESAPRREVRTIIVVFYVMVFLHACYSPYLIVLHEQNVVTASDIPTPLALITGGVWVTGRNIGGRYLYMVIDKCVTMNDMYHAYEQLCELLVR